MSTAAVEEIQGQILIVEDDGDVRQAIAEVLQESGYCALQAGNGLEALELLRDGVRPWLILLDIMMPTMDGWQFRAEQRRDPQLSGIPVVVLTAHADAAMAARRMNAAAFLRKPVPLQKLLDTVAHFRKI